jgi:hypothetical protein
MDRKSHYPPTLLAKPYAAFLPAVLDNGWVLEFNGPGEYAVAGRKSGYRVWVVDERCADVFKSFMSIPVISAEPARLASTQADAWESVGRLLADELTEADVHRYARGVLGKEWDGAVGRGVAQRVRRPPARLVADPNHMAAFLATWGPLTPSRRDARQSIWDYQFTAPLLDLRRIVGRESSLTTDQRLQLAISMLRDLPEDSLLIALTVVALSELSAGHADYRPCRGCGTWFQEPEYDPSQHIKGGRLRAGRSKAEYHNARCRHAAAERRRRARRRVHDGVLTVSPL